MTGRFALFADCLLLGLFTALAAMPVLTAYPAFVASCTMLRDGVPVGPGTYLPRLAQVIRSSPHTLWVPVAASAILGLDMVAVAAGVPGAKPLAALLVAAALAALVLALRYAADWQPGQTVRSVLARAGRDLSGSGLLLLAGFTAAAIVLLMPITALLVTGPLALASVAVRRSGQG